MAVGKLSRLPEGPGATRQRHHSMLPPTHQQSRAAAALLEAEPVGLLNALVLTALQLTFDMRDTSILMKASVPAGLDSPVKDLCTLCEDNKACCCRPMRQAQLSCSCNAGGLAGRLPCH